MDDDDDDDDNDDDDDDDRPFTPLIHSPILSCVKEHEQKH